MLQRVCMPQCRWDSDANFKQLDCPDEHSMSRIRACRRTRREGKRRSRRQTMQAKVKLRARARRTNRSSRERPWRSSRASCSAWSTWTAVATTGASCLFSLRISHDMAWLGPCCFIGHQVKHHAVLSSWTAIMPRSAPNSTSLSQSDDCISSLPCNGNWTFVFAGWYSEVPCPPGYRMTGDIPGHGWPVNGQCLLACLTPHGSPQVNPEAHL